MKLSKICMMSIATMAAAGLTVLPACEDEAGYEGGAIEGPVVDQPNSTGNVFEDAGRDLDASLDRAGESLRGAGSEIEQGVGEMGRETEQGIGELERSGENLGNELEGIGEREGDALRQNLEQRDGALPPAEQPTPGAGQ